jgi:hypothetical protein
MEVIYQDLLKSGDLFEMYYGMTGKWDEDKIKFKRQQEDLESFTNSEENIYGEFTD